MSQRLRCAIAIFDRRPKKAKYCPQTILWSICEPLIFQKTKKLLELKDPQLAKFIWTLVDGISLHQIDDKSNSFAAEIELLTQMLIAYFEKHILV